MIELILQLCTAMACISVILRTEPALNNMDRDTDFLVRFAFWLICFTCAWELLTIWLYDHIPDSREALLSGGIASLLLCERRIRYLARGGIRRRAPQ